MSNRNLLSFTIIYLILINIKWHQTIVNAEQSNETTANFSLPLNEQEPDTNGTIISRKGQEKSIDIKNDNQTIVNNGNDNEDSIRNKNIANEMFKSMRRIPIGMPKKSLTSFTNGWRAISIPKYKQSLLNNGNKTEIKSKMPIQETVANINRPKLSFGNLKEKLKNKTEKEKSTNVTFSMKCEVDGQQYINGDIIPNPENFCINCRCFYGKKMCQEQKCPPAPSDECIAEKNDKQCCPVYTCKSSLITNTATTVAPIINDTIKMDQSPIRRGPQYITDSYMDAKLESTIRKINNNQSEHFEMKSSEQRKLIMPPLNSLMYNYPLSPNRVHFPSKPKTSSASNLNGINTFDYVTSSIFNRQLFEMLTKQMKPVVNENNDGMVDENQHQMSTNNNSPIRTRPQSPQFDENILQTAPSSSTTTKSNIINEQQKSEPEPTTEMPIITTVGSISETTKYSSPKRAVVSNANISNLLQISGCNIYGKMYKIDETINELSNQCKTCVCANFGVKCMQKC